MDAHLVISASVIYISRHPRVQPSTEGVVREGADNALAQPNS
jgi:hypothetical protein